MAAELGVWEEIQLGHKRKVVSQKKIKKILDNCRFDS